MVRTKKKRKVDGATADFKRIKRKVGKRAPPPSTHTATEIKSKKIHLREQSVAVNKEGVLVSSKNLTIAELLMKLKHHNGTVRKEALEGLVEIIETFGQQEPSIKSQAGTIVTTVVELINDGEKQVRKTLEQLLAVLFEMPYSVDSAVHWCTPFFKLIMFHVCAALSSLQLSRRVGALSLIDLLMKYFPMLVKRFELELVSLYNNLLQTALSEMGGSRTAVLASSGGDKNASEGMMMNIGGPRSGGIMQNFKKEQKNSRKKKTSAKTAASGSSSQTSSSTSEAWIHVSEAWLKLLKYIRTHENGSNLDEELQEDGNCVNDNYDDYRILCNGLPEFDEESVQFTNISSTYVDGVKTVFSLLTHSHTLYTNSIKQQQQPHVLDTMVKTMETSTELLLLIMQRSKTFSGLEKVGFKYMSLLMDVFPIKSVSASHSTDRFVDVNLNVIQICFILLREMKTHANTPSEKKICQEMAEKVDKYLMQQLKRRNDCPPRLIRIAKRAIDELAPFHQIQEGAQEGKLKTLFMESFDYWLRLSMDDHDISDRMYWNSLQQVMESVLLVLRDPAYHIPFEWHLALPKLIWQGFQQEDEIAMTVAENALLILKETVKTQPIISIAVAHQQDWDLIAKRLVPILLIQKKSTGEIEQGPFLTKLNQSRQVQLIDVIAMLPVPVLPESMLRAICHIIVYLNDTSATTAVISRMIQIPFLKFRYGLELATIPSELQEQLLEDIISFTGSLLWGGSSNTQTNADGGDGHVAAIVDMLANHIVSLYRICEAPYGTAIVDLFPDQDLETIICSSVAETSDDMIKTRMERLTRFFARILENGVSLTAMFDDGKVPETLFAALFVHTLSRKCEIDVFRYISPCESLITTYLELYVLSAKKLDDKLKVELMREWFNAIYRHGYAIETIPPEFLRKLKSAKGNIYGNLLEFQ